MSIFTAETNICFPANSGFAEEAGPRPRLYGPALLSDPHTEEAGD